MNYSETINITVVAGDLSDEEREKAAQIAACEQDEIATWTPSSSSRIRVETSLRNGMEFHFPALRSVRESLLLTVFSIFWTGCVWLMFHSSAPVFLCVLFAAPVPALVFIIAMDWGGSMLAVASGEGVHVTRSLMGISFTKRMAASEIASIKSRPCAAFRTADYYDLVIRRRDGKEVKAGINIADFLESKWLANEMAKAIQNRS